jgi:hypothetical protein
VEIKLKPLAKGMASFVVPALRSMRSSGFETTGPDYCYSVFLRHFSHIAPVSGGAVPKSVAEFGPGSSIGVGLCALLAGAQTYTGLDVVDCTNEALNLQAFDRLVEMFRARLPVPQTGSFNPIFTPAADWAFPESLVPNLERSLEPERLNRIRADIVAKTGAFIRVATPWTRADVIPRGSLDWIFSQSVLEHVDDAAKVYDCARLWLRSGGLMSHETDYTSHDLTHHWNGHWTIGDAAWRALRGKRPYLINRLPHSAHVAMLNARGFEILTELPQVQADDAVPQSQFAPAFRSMSAADATTSLVFFVARAPSA